MAGNSLIGWMVFDYRTGPVTPQLLHSKDTSPFSRLSALLQAERRVRLLTQKCQNRIEINVVFIIFSPVY